MEAKFLASALSFLSIFLAVYAQSLGKYHHQHKIKKTISNNNINNKSNNNNHLCTKYNKHNNKQKKAPLTFRPLHPSTPIGWPKPKNNIENVCAADCSCDSRNCKTENRIEQRAPTKQNKNG